MTDLLERAVETARSLPLELQDAMARHILSFVADDELLVELTPEDEAALDEAYAAAARGEFATEEEIRAIWAKHGL